jgi:hypothetical protein
MRSRTLGISANGALNGALSGKAALLPAKARAVVLKPSVPASSIARLHDALDRGVSPRLAVGEEQFANRRDEASSHAFFNLVADLQEQGFHVLSHAGGISAVQPNADATISESVVEAKLRLRSYLLKQRNAQLRLPSVQKFLRSMERQKRHGEGLVSILNLVDDGHRLSRELADIAVLPPSDRLDRINRVIKPKLEIVLPGSVCSETGFNLIDVWRYFRHTWSLEYRPTPGRSLLFLIRNEAVPYSPVMAIASLSNAVPNLGPRDQWIGWNVRSLFARLSGIGHAAADAEFQNILEAMRRTLANAKELIRSDDLYAQIGACEADVLEQRLYSIARAYSVDREKSLIARHQTHTAGHKQKSLRSLPQKDDGSTDWIAASESPLFVRKRAQTLADLMFASRLLNEILPSWSEVAPKLQASSAYKKAFAIGFREIRKVGLASRLLDLNVCGAAPPYREILAGKLAALACASEEIREAYEKRYSNQVSEITSQMAGRIVVRTPTICALTTTSLYNLGTSQYNRLKLTVDSDGTCIWWEDLGHSKGQGTVHLSNATIRWLRQLSIVEKGSRTINNLFGEGTSPRLRQVREAVALLGLNAEDVLQHSTPRRVYGLELYKGGRADLLLNRRSSSLVPRFATISHAWMQRWLIGRVANQKVLSDIQRQGPGTVHADLHPTRQTVPNDENVQNLSSKIEPPIGKAPMNSRTPENPAELVRRLYKSLASCADHHDKETIELLHVPTAVDDFVLGEIRAGKLVFVTGNPGDGKTHLLRKLQTHTDTVASICLDANEQSDDWLSAFIEKTLISQGGGAMAINQGILLDLLRSASGKEWAAETRRQLLHPFDYKSASQIYRASEALHPKIRVVDLSLRNNLGRDVISRSLDIMTELSLTCGLCEPGACVGVFNAERLLHGSVRRRLTDLLNRVSRTGSHSTMRDVQGFLSYLIFGDTDCPRQRATATPQTEAPYWQNAFSGGTGPLFETLRRFDPVANTSPAIDDVLWRQADRDNNWRLKLDERSMVGQTFADRRDAFISRKRRALFELENAQHLVESAGSEADQTFVNLIDTSKPRAATVVRLLNRFFDRDEERDDVLFLWTTHRYDARSSRYAAAAVTVPTNSLEIVTPSLPDELAGAFPDFAPMSLVFRQKGSEINTGLLIDRPFLEAILAADKGMPSVFRRGEPEARIAAFYDRLARRAWINAEDDAMRVRLVDIDSGRNYQLDVDLNNRKYQRY